MAPQLDSDDTRRMEAYDRTRFHPRRRSEGSMTLTTGENSMTIRTLAVYLFTICGICACTQAPPAATSEQVSPLRDEQPPAFIAATIEAPTPEMLRAALSGDPEAMRNAIPAAGTCHTATTCPGFGSCTVWSAFSFCGDTCTKRCCHDAPICHEPDIGGTIFNERFRVCFNPAGASCTEWGIQSSVVCGC